MSPAQGPSFPDDGPADNEPEQAMGWGARIALAAVVAAVVLVIVLHLTGTVGPAAH